MPKLHLDSSQKQDQPDNSYRFTAQEQKDEQGFDDLLQRLSNNTRFSYKALEMKRQKLMKSFVSAGTCVGELVVKTYSILTLGMTEL
jgi:hypothetical protein